VQERKRVGKETIKHESKNGIVVELGIGGSRCLSCCKLATLRDIAACAKLLSATILKTWPRNKKKAFVGAPPGAFSCGPFRWKGSPAKVQGPSYSAENGGVEKKNPDAGGKSSPGRPFQPDAGGRWNSPQKAVRETLDPAGGGGPEVGESRHLSGSGPLLSDPVGSPKTQSARPWAKPTHSGGRRFGWAGRPHGGAAAKQEVSGEGKWARIEPDPPPHRSRGAGSRWARRSSSSRIAKKLVSAEARVADSTSRLRRSRDQRGDRKHTPPGFFTLIGPE